VPSLGHVDRYRDVALVLARHGLGFLIGVAGLNRWLPAPIVVDGAGIPAARPTNPAHLRLALEELGPTFIKLGQMLSTRSDLLPTEYLTELAKLQDDAPPVSAEIIRRLVTQELGSSPEEVFREFDMVPLASASIGQAHSAVLKDGTQVVVKVRRPDVVPLINEDLEILTNLAAQASRRWTIAADYNLIGIVAEFARSLKSELDYLHEGRAAERFAANFDGDPSIQIPRVFWDSTTSRVLTLERIEGVKIDDLAGLDRQGIDHAALMETAIKAIAQMVFVDGFFHADPHPGNLFVQSNGTIGLIDFGMVGTIDADLRDRLANLLIALARNDPDRITAALIKASVPRAPVDVNELRADVAGFVALYRGQGLAEIEIGPLISRLLGILRHHRLQLDTQLLLLIRMLVMVEGIGVRLDPDFSLGESLRPYAAKMARDRLSPRAFAKRLSRAGLEVAELGVELPERLRKLFDLLDTNGVEVHLRAAELDPLVGRVEKIGNRLVAGVIVAAFIRGIGELTAGDKTRWRSWNGPLLGAGVGVAGLLSAYLAWTTRRASGRGRQGWF
jgi:ubiquinone biosynthesis protein